MIKIHPDFYLGAFAYNLLYLIYLFLGSKISYEFSILVFICFGIIYLINRKP
jgi:hypothetical protein